MDNRKWIIENKKAKIENKREKIENRRLTLIDHRSSIKHLFSIFHFRFSHKGQVVMEFTFCMIVLLLMIYGLLQIFQWTGLDLADRRKAHDALLTTDITPDYGECLVPGMFGVGCMVWNPSAAADGPLKQIDPYFYQGRSMNAVWSDY